MTSHASGLAMHSERYELHSNDTIGFIVNFSPCQWVNAYTVVAMDTGERIHLISAKTDAEVEVCSVLKDKDAASDIDPPPPTHTHTHHAGLGFEAG